MWASLDVQTIAEAIDALAVREGIPPKDVSQNIGSWSEEPASNTSVAGTIGKWAIEHGLTDVVWTALQPKIGKEYRTPTDREVVGHLAALQGLDRDRAEEYIRLAPRQIATPYRAAIERDLGWTAKGLV